MNTQIPTFWSPRCLYQQAATCASLWVCLVLLWLLYLRLPMNEMLPILFVPQVLFAWFFVAPDPMPSWLRWARYLCTLTYAAVRIYIVKEFYDCNPADPVGNGNGNRMVDKSDGDPDEIWWNWTVFIPHVSLLPHFGVDDFTRQGYDVLLE